VFQKVTTIVVVLVHLRLSSFLQVFNADIQNLLSMADMWRHRTPPVPLDYDGIMGGTFLLRPDQSSSTATAVNGRTINGARGATVVSVNTNGKINGNAKIESSAAKLKDQRKLTLKDNLELFISRQVFFFIDIPSAWLKRGQVQLVYLRASEMGRCQYPLTRTTTTHWIS
jgi:hypothetical protein